MRYAASLAVILLAAVPHRQEPVHQAQLKAWANDFAGRWISELVAQEDAGPVKKGATFVGHHSYEWSSDKEVLHMRYWAELDGKTFNTTKGIVGWDAATNSVVMKWFNSLGESGELSYAKKGQDWSIKWKSVNSAGTQSVSEGSIKLQGNEQRIHMTDRKAGGEPQPDLDLLWKRDTSGK